MAEKEGRWGLEGLGPRRKAAGFTQASFAEALGIERGRYSMWESCAVWPSAQWLRPMAALLGCSVEDLYDVPEKETDCHTSAAAQQSLECRALPARQNAPPWGEPRSARRR